MKSAPKNRAQRAVAASALLVVLPLSGCNLTAEQSTTTQYAASDGIVEDLGPVLLRNILVVGSDDEAAGRLVGTVFNTSDDPVDLSIRAGDVTTSVTIQGQGQIKFEDETEDDATLEGLEENPGSLIAMDFEVDGEQATFSVPVLDGTLEEYREFVPGGFTPRPSETATTEEATEGE